ncbi:hypothetical protein ACFQGE_14750 [Halomicroarcula sp. GCM10025817]|uniref:capsular polysaccharide export protein, LipB/KpsS family n=1 Tax=Haloarcula TaxID=2237 RepID=UPI0023E8C4A4|nr:hypothetical protein [Halomicroarcula sp. SYNS111]
MDLKDKVLSTARRGGVDGPVLSLYYEMLDNDIDFDVDERIASYSLAAEDVEGRVLFPLVESGKHAWTYTSSILAHAFRVRGYEPMFLVCDGDLGMCPRQFDRGESPATCSKCHYKGNRILQQFGFDHATVGEVLPSGYEPPSLGGYDDLRDVTYRDVHVSTFALGSTRQALRKYHVDFEDPEEGRVYRELLRNSLVLVDALEALLDRTSIDVAIGSRPVYMYEGMLLEVAANRGLDARTYHASGFRSEKILFGDLSNEHSHQTFTDADYVEEVLSTPLSDNKCVEVDNIMAGRQDGSEVRVHYTEGANETVEAEDSETVLGLFTHVLWDAAIEVEQIIFEDIFEWVTETIEYVGTKDDTRLIIKPHPGELGRKTNEKMYDWIHDNVADVPDNVDVLRPDTDVDTYKLIEQLDAGLVYASTVGLEMAYYGYPAVVVGKAHYRDFDFTFDPDTLAEYCDMIDSAAELEVTPEMRDRARRYAHLLLVRKELDFPYYSVSGFDHTAYRDVEHDDLTPGNEPFDTIVDCILAGDPVVRS